MKLRCLLLEIDFIQTRFNKKPVKSKLWFDFMFDFIQITINFNLNFMSFQSNLNI